MKFIAVLYLLLAFVLGESSLSGDFVNNFNGDKPELETTLPNIPGLSDEDCPPTTPCDELKATCIDCQFTENCVYGNLTTVTCKALKKCKGPVIFERNFTCQFCYQTERWEQSCTEKVNCDSVASPPAYYRTNCTVKEEILCLGRRTFPRNLPCNWTGGHRWSTALILSVTLGGFGADRFYLGYWQEGIGKLFSFGGLGVWTLIDFILIAIQYLGPADGSLYI